MLPALFGYGVLLSVGFLVVAYGLSLFSGYLSKTVMTYGTVGTPRLLFAFTAIGVSVVLVAFMGALKTTLESVSFG